MVPAAFLIAAAHPAGTRLGIAVAVFVVFVWLLPRPAPRPLSAAALCVIVAAWGFGATLVWGTGGATKLRFAFAFGPVGGPALLGCAIVGIIAAAGALRSFAHADRRAGTLLAGIFAVSFAAWSAAVRYSPIIAVVGLCTGGMALWWAATMSADEHSTQLDVPPAAPLARGARLRVLASFGLVVMSGPVFYAWLRWGPKSWVDPACGASLVLPAFIMSVAIPALAVGFTSRAAGRRTEAVAAAAVITILVAAAFCVVAFLLWFGQNNCGE